MISIIICSRDSNVNENIKKNINSTIGVDYEIVWIDNSENKYSMCSAYNEGVRRAIGEYLCFMHEDVTFLSNGWGVECVKEMSDPDVWMLAILGSRYMDRQYAYWYPTPFITGHTIEDGKIHSFSKELTSQDIVVGDGLWLCIKREAFENGVRWDENLFTGFDMYDMDISMQIKQKGKRIRTVSGIDLVHASNGNFSSRFYSECIKFHDKWDNMFPVASFPITDELKKKSDRFILERMNKFEYEDKERNKKLSRFPLSILYTLYKKFKR